MCGKPHAPGALPCGSSPRYALKRGMGGSRCRVGRSGKEINDLPMLGFEHQIVQPVPAALILYYIQSVS
jgi:hypothetical protein